MDIDIEKEADIRASSHLLSEKLPDDYKDMTESQLRDYCSDKGIIPSYSPTETVAKIGELSADLISYVDLVESSKLRDVCKQYVDDMASSNLITQEEGLKFYNEFIVEQDTMGGAKAFEKLASNIQEMEIL
jgi:hypothetical protein